MVSAALPVLPRRLERPLSHVIEVFVSEGTAELLGHVQLAGAILLIVVFAPMLILLKRRRGKVTGHGLSAETTVDLLITFALGTFTLSFFLVDRFGHLGEETGADG